MWIFPHERKTSFWMGRISRQLCGFLLFLTSSTLLSVLLLFNLSITPTWIPDCDSHILLFWIYSFIFIHYMFMMTFPSLGNSDHVSVFFDFPINSKQDTLFHCIAYIYSRADWDGLCDHLRDVPWENIFKISASALASEFCEWV